MLRPMHSDGGSDFRFNLDGYLTFVVGLMSRTCRSSDSYLKYNHKSGAVQL